MEILKKYDMIIFMKVKIKRLEPNIKLPQYQTKGAVAFDLAPKDKLILKPKEWKLAATGLIVKTPPGHMLLIAPRSSLFMKKGLALANTIGIIDQDYCGDKDEIKLALINLSDKEVEIKKGERIAQGVFVKISKVQWKEVKKMGKSRGGFGSTG